MSDTRRDWSSWPTEWAPDQPHVARAARRSSGGLPDNYAERTAGRGLDRFLAAEVRQLTHPVRAERPLILFSPAVPVGRADPVFRAAERREREELRAAERVRSTQRRGASNGSLWHGAGTRRRFVTAGLAAVLLLAGVASSTQAQQRYVVKSGDTVGSVATMFGVDPDAIVAASWVPDRANLTPGHVIVIPDPGQTPTEAALLAAEREGTSPWVETAYVVKPGDTLYAIANRYGLTSEALAAFNSLSEPGSIDPGQRLLVPPSRDGGAIAADEALPISESVVPEVDPALDLDVEPEPEAGLEPEPAPAVVPVGSFVSGVPTYVQARNLSCEYAASYIATSAFGAGVGEWVFEANVPQAQNPHWGYRGNIDGWWGNTDDYGIYPEALAPTLNANGFAADVFYSWGDASQLMAHIDAGHPVLTWLGFWGDTAVTLDDEGSYTVAAGMHVVVIYGYDEGGVYFSDPARGTYSYFSWNAFVGMWSVLDGMSMAVYPA